MTEIFLNGELADFEDKEVIAASYGNISFGELNKKKGIKTNTYKLPLTNRNKKIFENAELVNNASNLPYQYFDIVIKLFGIEVFNGFAAIVEAKTHYDVQSFSGISTFYNQISKKKLTELDLSAYNHIWDLASIVASWNNTAGYMYGYVWYGAFSNNDRVMAEYLHPQAFFHTVVKQIINDAGYSVAGKVWNDERFLRHMIVYGKFPKTFKFLDTIDLASTLPDVLQSKVILDFLNIYGVMLDVDDDEKIIYCDYIDDIIFREPIDWSHKIDDSEEPTKKYSLGYAQSNVLSFKDDPDMERTWNKEVLINNETLVSEGTIYASEFINIDSRLTLPSGPTNNITIKDGFDFIDVYNEDDPYGIDQKVYHFGSWYKAIQANNSSDIHHPDISPSYWKRVEEKDIFTFKTKVMYGAMFVNPSSGVTIASDPTDITVTRWISGDDLDWNISYQRHYRLFSRIIDKTKVIEILMKLNYADINQIDFTRPYWLDRYNSLFVLDEVMQYKLNETDSTLCRFIRL